LDYELLFDECDLRDWIATGEEAEVVEEKPEEAMEREFRDVGVVFEV
jgi:hypothetical protein